LITWLYVFVAYDHFMRVNTDLIMWRLQPEIMKSPPDRLSIDLVGIQFNWKKSIGPLQRLHVNTETALHCTALRSTRAWCYDLDANCSFLLLGWTA